MKNINDLRQLSIHLFDEELAQQIIEQIDKDNVEVEEQVELPDDQPQLHRNLNNNLDKVRSYKTIWLGDRFYNNLKVGAFIGKPNITVGDGLQNFNFTQNLNEPKFGYKTANGMLITPMSMPFNGGSIPNIAQIFSKLSPTYFISSYLIHDWLFHCHQKGILPESDLSFEETAIILAEAIKVTMETDHYNLEGEKVEIEKDEDVLYVIYQAVRTHIAKAIWEKKQ